MDSLSLTTQIALFLSSFIIYCYFKIKSTKNAKNHQTTPPEPPGALPVIGHLHLLGGKVPLCRTLGAMADEHGPIFSLRLGSHRGVVVSSREMMKECFTTNDRVFASRPSLAVGKFLGYDFASFGLSQYGPYWRDVRKMVTVDLFTARRLDDLSHVRMEEVDSFVKDLYSKSGGGGGGSKQVVALSSRIEHLTFNIIMRMLAGKKFPYSDGDEKDVEFKEAIKKALYLGGLFVYSDAIPALEWLDIGGHIKSMKQTYKEVDKVFEGWVHERIQTRKQNFDKSRSELDILEVMLSAIQENEMVGGYTRETVIKSTFLILMMTGSESTSETLIWTLSLLMNNPRTLKKAQDEIENIVGRHRWVQESDLNNLSYLQSIFKETLRLYPPGPLSGPREALEDCYIGKYYIPKGTRLTANLWKLHRDPNIWSDAEEFRPERFLNEKSEVNFKGQCFEFIPFSSGRRMCPGMLFGIRVILLALARLLQGFDMETAGGEAVDMGEGLGIALPKLKPLDILLTPRLPQQLYENL